MNAKISPELLMEMQTIRESITARANRPFSISRFTLVNFLVKVFYQLRFLFRQYPK